MNRVFLFSFLLTAFILAGCKPEMNFVESSIHAGQAEASLSGDKLSVVFPSGSGSASVSLEANRKWSATFVNDRAKEWCSLSPDNGSRGTASISVSVKENPDYDERSASILFTCGDVQRTIVVTQKQKDALLLSGKRQDVGKDGDIISIEVKANVDFRYSVSEKAASWITFRSTKGLSTSVLSFQVAANEEIERRDGTITISSALGTEEVKVYQEGATPTLVVSAGEVPLPADESTFLVEVQSNVNVSVDIPASATWLSEDKTKAMSTSTFRFKAQENEAFRSREAVITFRNVAQKLEESVKVIQAAATPLIIVGQTEYAFEAEGGSLDIEVTSNLGVSVMVPDTCSWIKSLQTKALTTRTYGFAIAENESFKDREGKIVFQNKEQGLEEVVTVSQKAAVPTLIIGQKEYAFEAKGGSLDIELSSNMDIDILVSPGCDWLEPVTTKAVTTRHHLFSVKKNHGRSDREGWIVFRNLPQERSDTVFISQAFQPILVPCDILPASGRGWTVSFGTIGTKPDAYRIEPADSWLSLIGKEGSPNGSRFQIAVQAMETEEYSRLGQILVYDKEYDEPDIVQVRQYAPFPVFSYTTSLHEVTVPPLEQEDQMGFITWGDGQRDTWQADLSHTFTTGGLHTVTVEIRNKSLVTIPQLENGMTIHLRDLRN